MNDKKKLQLYFTVIAFCFLGIVMILAFTALVTTAKEREQHSYKKSCNADKSACVMVPKR